MSGQRKARAEVSEGGGAPGTPPSFENALGRLSEIVERLEGGELPLEESLKLFEEGVRMARTAESRLDAAEKRVEELLGIDGDGNPIVRELGDEVG
jgi:exodeoxyribonuclease VII small subunit